MNRDMPILLVEDDRLDVKNIERAFSQHRILNPLYVVGNGEEALAFLRNEPPHSNPVDAPRPGLIILDLNLPVMNGIEFLGIYKNDPGLKMIPSVVMTTSEEERDLVASYKIGIAGYIVKPVDFVKFTKAVQIFDLYWTLCALP